MKVAGTASDTYLGDENFNSAALRGISLVGPNDDRSHHRLLFGAALWLGAIGRPSSRHPWTEAAKG